MADYRQEISETTELIEDHKEQKREVTTERNAAKQEEHLREATAWRKAFIMVACLFLNFIAGGIVVALGVIYVDLIRVLDAQHSQAALVQSVFMGTMIGGGVIFTGVLQKYGTGLPIMIASLIAGMAFFASSFAPNVPTLIALVGAVGGLSMCIVYLSVYVTIGWTFAENRKTALALLTIGWAVGQIIFPVITQFLVEYLSWNGSFVILSGLILNCIPGGLLIHTSKDFFLISKTPAKSLRDTVCGCVKDYIFVLFVLAYFLFFGLAPIEMWFITDLAVVRGFDRNIGAILLSLLGVFGLIGRLIATILLRIFKNTEALVHAFYSIIIWGIGHFLVGYFRELWGLVFAVLLRGISAGVAIGVMPGSQIEMRGVEKYPQTAAICNLIGGVSQILGGLLGGVTVDLTGGYELIFTLAAVVFFVCGVLIISVWLLRRKQRKSTTADEKADDDNDGEKALLISKLYNRRNTWPKINL